jgi:hypothetical protein
MDTRMGFGKKTTERHGLENDWSSGFESLIVFVIIFTGRIGEINCNYKSELTLKMLSVCVRLYYWHNHHRDHITSTVIP